MYKPGDWIVYRAVKYSAHPSPRALEVHPEPHGEMYSYEVEKYWAVEQVLSDGSLVAVTRRGKRRTIDGDDPRVRRARWWEILFLSKRFPEPRVAETPNGARVVA